MEELWPVLENTANKIHRLVVERQVTSGRSEADIHAGIERALGAYLAERARAA